MVVLLHETFMGISIGKLAECPPVLQLRVEVKVMKEQVSADATTATQAS